MSPRFSFVTPVYNTPGDVLRECIDSVRAQSYDDWEMCLVDDGSTAGHIGAALREASESDDRIRVAHRAANGGIVAASNDALAMATGEFVVLLDHDDVIEPDALQLVADALDLSDEVDVVYSDADKLDPTGKQVHPFHKPDWSPERFRHQNYLIHVAVVRRSLVVDVGGFREGFDGAQDYDLLLRVVERSRGIHHIPRILYHWRIIPGSTAGDTQAKPAAYEAGRRAIGDHCARVGIGADVQLVAGHPGSYRVVRRRPRTPSVSVVMPTAGGRRRIWGANKVLALHAIESVEGVTDYGPIEWVVAFGEGCDDQFHDAVRERCGGRLVEVQQSSGAFNFSDAVNRGVHASSGEVVVLLNDDTEVLTPTWLDQFVAVLEETDVGTVGPKLLHADLKVQSGGHWHGKTPEHLGRGAERTDPGPFAALLVARECSSLSAACLAVRRSTWERVGGMTPLLPNAYNDADFGNKIRANGLRNVWLPWVEIVHHEISTRDPFVPQEHLDLYHSRWRGEFRPERYAGGSW